MINPAVQYLLDELHKQRKFIVNQLAHFSDNVWIDSSNNSELDPAIASEIRALKEGDKFKKIAGGRAIVHAGKSKRAVIVQCSNKTRDKTLEAWHAAFITCINSATKSYFANHDPLTAVFNRYGIQVQLEQLWTSSEGDPSPDKAVDFQIAGNAHIAIFAFDIDSFKAVNDTYTHDVGDAVLVIFAKRISELTRHIEEQFEVQCIFGRPGGEEFELVVRKTEGPVPVSAISEKLLECIRRPSLPSDDEIDRYKKDNPQSAVSVENLPFPAGVTASIGVAMQKLAGRERYSDKLYSGLRLKADVACYRAKSDGKNCFRAHAEIKLKHGRVLESFVDSGLVVIDIGEEMGVSRHDLFRVFFPPFQDQDIVQNDGRTAKKIGKYALIESARITVKEVQKKVAICLVQDRQTDSQIPKGSLLHYVHTGSIPFALPRNNERTLAISSGQCAREYVGHLLETNQLDLVISLAGEFENDSDFSAEDQRTMLSNNVFLNFPAGTRVFRGVGLGFFIICKSARSGEGKPKKLNINALLSQISQGMKRVIAGVYRYGDAPSGFSITPDSILFLASAAKNAAKSAENNQKVFSHVVSDTTPNSTIYAWRKLASVDDALVDYQKFRELGANSALLDNQLGLALMSSQRPDLTAVAESAFSRATQDADEKVYIANLALLRARIGKYKEAYKDFSRAESYIRNDSQFYSYFLGFAYSAMKANVADETVLPLMHEALNRVQKCPENVIYRSWWRELQDELAKNG